MARIDQYLYELIERDGSDVHLCVGLPPKIRVNGRLEPLDEDPIDEETMLDLLREPCPDDKWDEFVTNLDMDYAYELENQARFRVNYMHNHFGPGCVMRLIPTDILAFSQLGLPEILTEVCEYTRGLVLVTGPTGSGKSTTLAAMMDYINENYARHIITIEDPIEFVHENKNSVIIQREIGTDTDSFGAALRGAMRADPDIILVGEMRDLITINLALTCAAMGMLVFGTLHTNNAPKTVDRIIDAFPADDQPQIRAMLAQSLKAVVSQLLCRTADGKGRVAALEILLSHDALPSTIREAQISNIRSIIEQSAGRGMRSMDSDLKRLLNDGRITPLEAFMKASNKREFEGYLDKNAFQQLT